jgi:hypothetical protein
MGHDFGERWGAKLRKFSGRLCEKAELMQTSDRKSKGSL